MNNVTIHRIAGDWLDDGYLRDFSPRRLDVEIEDGRIYDADRYCGRRLEITVEAAGSLVGWGEGVEFSSDAGEIDRILAAHATRNN